MRILRFYILKEFVPPYLGSMAFFTMLLLLERVMSFVRLVVQGYATVIDLLVLVFYSVPPTLALTMPMSTIMGALIAVGRLSHDSEITAIRAGGIRLSSIFLSLYLAGAALGGASYFLTDRLVPVGNLKFRTLYQKLTIARPDAQIDPRSINRISGRVTLLVEGVDSKTGDLAGVTLFESKEKGGYKTITARRGFFVPQGELLPYITLRLVDGTITDSKDREGTRFESTLFRLFDMNIPVSGAEIKNIVKTPRDMNLRELKEGIAALETGTKSFNTYTMEYHKKIAIPFACLLFVFLGTPFALTRGRSGKGLGLGSGVLIIFFYFVFLISLERVGRNGSVPPALSMWLPNMLFFAAGVFNLIRKGRV